MTATLKGNRLTDHIAMRLREMIEARSPDAEVSACPTRRTRDRYYEAAQTEHRTHQGAEEADGVAKIGREKTRPTRVSGRNKEDRWR